MFNPFTIARLLVSSIASIAAKAGQKGAYSLALGLKRAFPLIKDQPFAAFQGVATRALRMYRAGQAMNDDIVRRLTVRELPIDGSIRPEDPRFMYRAIVKVRNAAGQEVRFQASVRSDERLNLVEVEDYLRNNFESIQSPARGTRQAIAALGERTSVSVEMLAAGRR